MANAIEKSATAEPSCYYGRQMNGGEPKMRRGAVALVILIALAWCEPLAVAHAQPPTAVLVDQVIRMYPGAGAVGEFVVDTPGALVIVASSPPGRTGCDVTLTMRRYLTEDAGTPLTFLGAPLVLDDLTIRYPAAAGRYEYVTQTLNCPTPVMPRDDPAYPDKQVGLKVVLQPGID
jgi:hypothetical protein